MPAANASAINLALLCRLFGEGRVRFGNDLLIMSRGDNSSPADGKKRRTVTVGDLVESICEAKSYTKDLMASAASSQTAVKRTLVPSATSLAVAAAMDEYDNIYSDAFHIDEFGQEAAIGGRSLFNA